MSRKLISLVLALMLLLTAVAFADGIGPSKVNGDLTQVVMPPNTPAGMKVSTKEQTDYSLAVFNQLDAFIANGNNAIDFFPTETIQKIKDALPLGVNADNLKINEFSPLSVEGFDSTCPDLVINFEFPTEYVQGTALVVLIGYLPEDGSATEWIIAPYMINADGSVDITFTTDTLAKVASGNAVLTILS